MNIAFFANPTSIHDVKWINRLAKEHGVIVICGECNPEKVLLDATIPIYPVIDGGYPMFNLYRKQKIVKQLKTIFKTHKIDIVHSMYIVPNAFWVDDTGFKNHIITTRGSDVLVEYETKFHGGRTLLKKYTDNYLRNKLRKALNNAKYITSTSTQQQQTIKQFIHDKDKLHLIRTGIDTKAFLNQLNILPDKKTENKLLLFSPRRMLPIYNIDIIVKAGKQLIDKGFKNFKLLLIDDAPHTEYSNTIHALIHSLQINEYCLYLPQQTNEDMIKQYLRSDIVVMIPKSDGTPVSAIEAMLAKKPVVLGNLDYDSDLFNDNTVWKLTSFAPEELAKIILSITNDSKENITLKIQTAYENTLELADMEKSLKLLTKLYIKTSLS